MQIEVTELESINIPKGVTKIAGSKISHPPHEDNKSHLE